VQQAVNSTEVDERTEVGDVLDDALLDVAYIDAFHRLALQFLALLLDHLAAADDDVAAFLVDLEDHRVDGTTDPVADFARTADVDLAGRQEDRYANIDQQATLDLLGDLAGNGVAFLLALHDGFPVDDPISLALADLHQTGVTFDIFKQDAHFVAHLNVFGLVELIALEDAFALKTELDDEIVAALAGNLPLDDRAGGKVLNLVPLNELAQIIGGVTQCQTYCGVDFLIEVSERIDKIVIDHMLNAAENIPPILVNARPNLEVENHRRPRGTG
jgi:hypothetical protein